MGGMGSGPQKAVRRGGQVKLRAPERMVAGAERHFREVARRAKEHGLTQADQAALGMLATALWLFDEAAAALAAEGLTTADEAHGGEPRKHPAVSILRAAHSMALPLMGQFGLTPGSRARLGLAEESEVPSLAEILFAPVAGDD